MPGFNLCKAYGLFEIVSRKPGCTVPDFCKVYGLHEIVINSKRTILNHIQTYPIPAGGYITEDRKGSVLNHSPVYLSSVEAHNIRQGSALSSMPTSISQGAVEKVFLTAKHAKVAQRTQRQITENMLFANFAYLLCELCG